MSEFKSMFLRINSYPKSHGKIRFVEEDSIAKEVVICPHSRSRIVAKLRKTPVRLIYHCIQTISSSGTSSISVNVGSKEKPKLLQENEKPQSFICIFASKS